jgi:hypothetical protein
LQQQLRRELAVDVVERLLPGPAEQLLQVGHLHQDGVVPLLLVVVLLRVQDLLAREGEVLEQLAHVLELALRPLQVLHHEVRAVAVGEGQRLPQVRRQLARLAGEHPRLVGLVDAADHHLELVLELVLPADRRRVAFDDALQGEDEVVVGFVLDRQGRQLVVLVLGGVRQLVDERDALHVDAHGLQGLFLAVLALAGTDQPELLGLGVIEPGDRAAEKLEIGLVDVQVGRDQPELGVAALVAVGLLLGQVLLELVLEEVDELLLGVGADGDLVLELEAAEPGDVFLVLGGLLFIVVLLGLVLVLRRGGKEGEEQGGKDGEQAGHEPFLKNH